MASPILHSSLGASISKRYMACPGSVALCAKLPKPPSSPAADEGTRLHALSDLCVSSGERDAAIYAGLRLEGEPTTLPPLEKLQCYAVNTSLEHVYSLIDQPGAVHWTEQAFDLEHIRPGMFGTNDCAVLIGETLHVIDYKYGRGVPVEVENNSQLFYYALGAVRAMELRGETAPNTIVITIIQPRCPHPDGPVRSQTVDILALMEFENELRAAVEATQDPAAPLVTGSHCQFCPGTYVGKAGRMQCPKFEADANAATDSAFAVVADPPALASMSADEIGLRYSQLAVLERYIAEFRAFVRDSARREVPTGYAWAPGNNRRSWKGDGAEALELVRAFEGEKADGLVKIVSPAQVEKSVSADVFALLADMVDKSPSAPMLLKKGARKKEMSLADVNDYFTINADAAFTTLPDE